MPRLGRIELVYRYQSKAALMRMAEERAESLRELGRGLRRSRRERALVERHEWVAVVSRLDEAA